MVPGLPGWVPVQAQPSPPEPQVSERCGERRHDPQMLGMEPGRGRLPSPSSCLVRKLRPGRHLGPGLGRNLEGHSQTKWGAHTSQGLLAPENALAAPRDSESDPFRGSLGLPPQAPTAAGILGEPDEALVFPSQGITPKGDPSAVGSLLRTPPRGALRGRAQARVCESPGVLLSTQVPEGSCT